MRKILFILLISGTMQARAQHSSVTSQYMFNTLVINPAYAGSMDALCISASHRSQWLSLPGAPETQNFSVHTPLRNENIGVGLMFYRDAIGVTRQNGVFFQYAYRIKMKRARLCFGLSAGAAFTKMYLSTVSTTTANDPVFVNDTPVYILPDASFGIFYYNPVFFTGVSVPFFVADKFGKTTMKDISTYENFNVHFLAGLYINRNGDFSIKPSMLIKANARMQPQGDFNLQFLLWQKVGFGVSYRSDDALVFPFQYYLNDQFMLSYSYDRTFSNLKNYQFGTHEVLLRYSFKHVVNAVNPRFF